MSLQSRCFPKGLLPGAWRLLLASCLFVPLLALVSCLFCAPLLARAQEGKPPDTWYAETVSRGERGFIVTNFWSKGARMRAEVVVAGHRIVSIISGEYYYSIDMVSGEGVAIRRSAAAVGADSKRGRPFATEYQELLEAGGEQVGSLDLGGRSCDLFRVTDSRGRRQVCVAPGEPRLPIQVETYRRRNSRTETVDYVNWVSGLQIPDAFFEPGPHIKLERVEYEDYRKRSLRELVGPAPVIYGHLLHGGGPSW